MKSEVLRTDYLEKLKKVDSLNLIKVITGARRCGKSTLLNQYKNIVKKDNNVIELDLDNKEFRELCDTKFWGYFYDLIKEKYAHGKVNYVFIDEIQNIKEFEKLLEALYVDKNTNIFVTGSNAYLLSSELATILTGRSFEINLLPLSYKEFLNLTEYEPSEKSLNEYLEFGGFPEAVKSLTIDKNIALEYLRSVYDNIYKNDISKKYNIYLEEKYTNIVRFMLDSVGSELSINNIANCLEIDNKTVDTYLETLINTYLFKRVNRFDIKGKKILKTSSKYYVTDLGFISAILGKDSKTDLGHKLENLVYLELLRRGYEVFIGKINNNEIDFFVKDKDGFTGYIQVSYSIKDIETKTREYKPLDMVKDHNEKIIITSDYGTRSINGVKCINIIDWLLN